MNVGDYVKIKQRVRELSSRRLDVYGNLMQGKLGMIIDCLEMSDGFYEYEVLIEGVAGWYNDLELEIISAV